MGGVTKIDVESMILFDSHWFIMKVRSVKECSRNLKVANLPSMVGSSYEEQSGPFFCSIHIVV